MNQNNPNTTYIIIGIVALICLCICCVCCISLFSGTWTTRSVVVMPTVNPQNVPASASFLSTSQPSTSTSQPTTSTSQSSTQQPQPTSEPTSGYKMHVNTPTLCVNHSEDNKMYGHACSNNDSQEWRYDANTGQIKNYRGRQIWCVDGSAGKGQPVTLKQCDNNSPTQKFNQHVWDNVGFQNRSNNMCLDILGGWGFDKQIGLWDCQKGINQRFYMSQ